MLFICCSLSDPLLSVYPSDSTLSVMGEMDKLEKLGELASYVHKSNFMPEFMTIYSIAESY